MVIFNEARYKTGSCRRGTFTAIIGHSPGRSGQPGERLWFLFSRTLACLALLCLLPLPKVHAANPILPGLGVTDPYARVYHGRVYLYVTHDYSVKNTHFRMDDWQEWSSADLVHWKQESTLLPQQTFIGKPFSDCWATAAASKNGLYYWYFSAGRNQIGVVSAPTPSGPWHDPLGKPLIPQGLTPVAERDPGILVDDDGSAYINFGTWGYYIARLNTTMISLAEPPRKISIDVEAGPYGAGKTDDKSCLSKHNGHYYLSWGCYYAMAANPYGPYAYKGSIIVPEKTDPKFRTRDLTADRHGNFFEYHNQTYFTCNDHSQPGSTPYFRNSILSYVHYRDNGEIAPIPITEIGVGEYDAARGAVEAEDYFSLNTGETRERPAGGFEVRGLVNGSVLGYPNVSHVPIRAKLLLRLSKGNLSACKIEVHSKSPQGALLGTVRVPSTRSWERAADVTVPLNNTQSTLDLYFVIHGTQGELVRLDSWRF